jgi:hypothetical protein
MATGKRARAKTSGTESGTEPTSVPAFDKIAAVLRAEGGVDEAGATGRRAFGAGALKVGGKIFAMPAGGTLVLKLPAARVNALVAEGRGKHFDPGHGRIMKEWIALEGNEASWLELAREAQAFVGRA